LWTVLKCVLILSHCNSVVASSFSINNEILVVILHDDSIVAQPQVYDAIYVAGGIKSVVIDIKPGMSDEEEES